jgi:hypothetical protein
MRAYLPVREVHTYLGLFVSPFVLVYSASAMLLNHAYLPWGGGSAIAEQPRTVPITIEQTANSLEMAKRVRSQISVRGEIDDVRHQRAGQRLDFDVETPGRTTNVRVDMAARLATVSSKRTGVWDALVDLHKMPGPHNAAIRGNWLFTRLWGWLADTTVYLILLLSVTGLYLWQALKSDRTAGLMFLGAGAISFSVIVALTVR